MLNEMHEVKKNESLDIQNEFSKEHIQKIESLKYIKKEEKDPRQPIQNKSTVPDKKVIPPPPIPNNSGVASKKKVEIKEQPNRGVPKEKKETNGPRSASTKKQPNLPLISKPQEDKRNIKSNRISSEKQNDERIE